MRPALPRHRRSSPTHFSPARFSPARFSPARLSLPLLGLSLLAVLAGCGVDGPPEPPLRNAAQTAPQTTTGTSSVSISGEGRFGAQTGL